MSTLAGVVSATDQVLAADVVASSLLSQPPLQPSPLCGAGFLYGVMKEVVYCVMPEGMKLVVDFDCLELVKAIYGLK
ncbi:hypothetical protein L914_01906 [Phytophthora nicotianae]|uniref:Uncharacterized protein n=1 Tax=Phytophthora nicotianae TaxID=4792 RepID=W2P3K5_PHYNI|nr:hypothetical protein L914_01906 [Phytophthora nicotianae]